MKQGNYLTIKQAFKNYEKNKYELEHYPMPTIAGIDYSKPAILGDKYQNATEKNILDEIDLIECLYKRVQLVEKTREWFEIEDKVYGRRRDKYVYYRYICGMSNLRASMEVHIDESTGRRWNFDVLEAAEIIGKKIGLFN